MRGNVGPDEAGTASTLQGSVSRAIVKDLSDANRAGETAEATEDVGLLIHAISVGQPPHSVHFGCRTRLGPSRRFDTGRLHGRFYHVRTPPARSAAMSPMSWSSHKVKRSVSASLAGEVFMMSEGWLLNANGSVVCWELAVYQDYEPSLHRRKSI